ncbi:MAG: DUF2341 domain-containing protein [Deltaproteobacteria bacterium]|nr:DUF2341 domain-containing protein [Deltaproteobacteria bacterium]MDQ3295850.1 DUF2341 domain-containing protein [Myxococcota bacterium]
MVSAVRFASVLLLAGCNSVFALDETATIGSGPRRLVFDNSASATDLVEFPVLVVLEPGVVDVDDPTRDLRFHDPDSDADLPFDVDVWDPAGSSLVWVKVPRIDAGSKTDEIVMYSGRDAGGLAAPAAVWADYDLVIHDAQADGTLTNAAAADYTTRGSGISRKPGALGHAIGLPGFAELPNTEPLLDGWTQFSLELWVYADYASGQLSTTDEAMFLDRGGSIQLGRVKDLGIAQGIVWLQIDTHFGDNSSYLNTVFSFRRWVHIVYTYDGQTLWMYQNGQFASVDPKPTPIAVTAGPARLKLGSQNTSMIGALDEVRVSRTYRDPDWVNAQFLTMNGRFVTIR